MNVAQAALSDLVVREQWRRYWADLRSRYPLAFAPIEQKDDRPPAIPAPRQGRIYSVGTSSAVSNVIPIPIPGGITWPSLTVVAKRPATWISPEEDRRLPTRAKPFGHLNKVTGTWDYWEEGE